MTHGLHHKGGFVGIVGGGAKSRGLSSTGQCRGRLRGLAAKLARALLALSKHESDERAPRGQVDLGVNTLEVFIIDAGLAALLDGVLPVRGVVIVIDGTLVNVIVLAVVGVDCVVIVVVVHVVSGDDVAERSLLLVRSQATTNARGQGTLERTLFLGRTSANLEHPLLAGLWGVALLAGRGRAADLEHLRVLGQNSLSGRGGGGLGDGSVHRGLGGCDLSGWDRRGEEATNDIGLAGLDLG